MNPRPARRPACPPLRSLTPGLVVLGGVLLLGLSGCGESSADRSRDVAENGAASDGPASARADSRTDTLRIEGVPEPITLRLFRADDDFPLPFTTYVPEEMAASTDESEGTAHFTAEFGGVRNEDAFIHLYVFPPDTHLEEAVALAKGYKTGRGIPVSRGIELIADELMPPHMDWAVQGFRFRYEGEDGVYAGTIGVGRHQDRHFMLLRHYPAEYGEGFEPRADLITDTWNWADGTGLSNGPRPEPPPIAEESPVRQP